MENRCEINKYKNSMHFTFMADKWLVYTEIIII